MSMTLISTVTVGAGGIGQIDFTSIPQTFTDVMVIFSVRTAFTGNTYQSIAIGFAPISGTVTGRNLYGLGSFTGSNTQNSIEVSTPTANATANTFGNVSVYFPNYTTSTNKSFSADAVGENNATTSGQNLGAYLFTTSSPITQINIDALGQTIVQHSTASLYGITKGSGGATVS